MTKHELIAEVLSATKDAITPFGHAVDRIIRDQQAQIELLTHALKEAVWLREHIMGSKKRINWGDTFDVDFGHMNEAFITFDRTLARIESGEWMEGGE